MYSDPTIKAATSKKWVPPGYITRLERDDSGLRARSVGEKHDKNDSSPDRGMSLHHEHAVGTSHAGVI
jgi:SP family sugar:H+ symporter-like MFS transporter